MRVLMIISLATAQCFSALAQQKSLNIRGALSIGLDDNYRNDQRLYGGRILVPVGNKWTLQLGGADPNTAFAICASKDNRAWPCVANFSKTDQYGNWTLSGTFDASTIGNWTEWIEFPSGATSNRIVFAVGDTSPAASLAINNRDLGVFHVNQPWTLQLSGAYGYYNESAEVCAEIFGATVSCTPASSTIDGNGEWSSQGTFANDVVGGWSLWLRFSDGQTTNRIAFTVDTAPLDDVTCDSGTMYPIGPNAGFAEFRRYDPDWGPTGPSDYTVIPDHPGGVGNTLEYLGCNGHNYVWLQWAYGGFMAFGARSPWSGQTDRGLRLGDDLARFQSLYPAAHHPLPLYGIVWWPDSLDVWVEGPLIVTFQGGKASMIGVDWSLYLLFPQDDQADTSANAIGPWDASLQWYPWI